jgi:hypothetical protein
MESEVSDGDTTGTSDRGTSDRFGTGTIPKRWPEKAPDPRRNPPADAPDLSSTHEPQELEGRKAGENKRTPRQDPSSAKRHPDAAQLPVGEDDRLVAIASAIVDKWDWIRDDLRRPMWVLAQHALFLFKKYELDEKRLRRVLHHLKFYRDGEVYEEFFRQTRNPDLGDYLDEHGVSWEEMFSHDLPTKADWAAFVLGVIEGVAGSYAINLAQLAMLPVDILKGIYVAVGRRWDPALEQTYQEFVSALAFLLGNLRKVAVSEWNKNLESIRRCLRRRQYRDAGVQLGGMAVGILFIAKDIKGLGQFGAKLVAHMPKLTLKAVEKLEIMSELARFYLAGHTNEILPKGIALARTENIIVVAKGAEKPFSISVDDLAPEIEKLRGAAHEGEGWPKLVHPTPKVGQWPRSPSKSSAPLPVSGVDEAARGLTTREPRTLLDEMLAEAQKKIADAARTDAQYKAERAAQGLSQKGGPGHKGLSNAREQDDVVRQIKERPDMDVLEQVKPQAFVLEDGTTVPVTGTKMAGRQWDWIGSDDGSHWSLVEKKTVKEILGSVEGGLYRGPIEATFRPSSRIGKEIAAERSIYKAAAQRGPKLLVQGKNPLTGQMESRIIDLENSSTSLTDYRRSINN